MWLSDLLRKITKGPKLGETFRDYIGCYLYGCEVSGSEKPEYVGAPTNLDQLEVEVRRYLQDFLDTQGESLTPEAQIVQALMPVLRERLSAHVATDMAQPFLQLSGVDFFIRQGVRQRRREKGRFVE